MNESLFLLAMLSAVLLNVVNSECPNACSGHGDCTAYDMCRCHRNWQSNDCSERTCQFGLAHVDTPKGDLDGSGDVTGFRHKVVENSFEYPFGTTEEFPAMQDSDQQFLENSAHFYMECSNRGVCDRITGECVCFEGYDGVSCQRASCPGYPFSCSGHGICRTKKQLAKLDNNNVYALWDKDLTMGCYCDAGYTGADCSERICKVGVDPMYLDDTQTLRYSTVHVAILTTAPTIDFYNGFAQPGGGHWALRFYDHTGEDWLTEPLSPGATCDQLIAALEDLPNNVVPAGQTLCTLTSNSNLAQNAWNNWDAQHPKGTKHAYKIFYNMSIWESMTPANQGEESYFTATTNYAATYDKGLSGYIYQLKLFGNPGYLREPEVEIYLDGLRPTLVSKTPNAKVITKTWMDGQHGEDKDYFADHCHGVTVRLDHIVLDSGVSDVYFLSGMTLAEKNLLKQCLGGADFDNTNNVDVYNWDYGTELYPHAIRLVRTVTVYTDGGYYAVIWYDTTINTVSDDSGDFTGVFRLLNPITPPDGYLTNNYDVYTTQGVLSLTSNYSQAIHSFASKTIYMTNSSYDTNGATFFDGDISCEVGDNNADKFKYIFHCLNKTDLFFLLTWDYPQYNPPHLNLYEAARIVTTETKHLRTDRIPTAYLPAGTENYNLNYMTHIINTNMATNWAAYTTGFSGFTGNDLLPNTGVTFRVYKFFPSKNSTYEYVSQCSNRGICDSQTGICDCFPGYTNDDCSVQNAIAM